MDHGTIDYEKTGAFIQELRIEKGLTQAQLAELLGITDRAVSKWETGKSFPDVSILKPLAKILDITVLELLDGQRQTETALSGEAAEESFIKGLQFYLRLKERRHRLYIIPLAICLVIFCIGGIRSCVGVYQTANEPTDLTSGNYFFTYVELESGQPGDENIHLELNQPEDEIIQDAIKNLLAKGTAGMKEVKSLPNAEGAEQTGFICIGDIVSVNSKGYFDQDGGTCYMGDDAAELFEQLWSLIADYQAEKEGAYQYDGKLQYQYKDRILTLACQPESRAEELIVKDFHRQLKQKSDTGLQDAYRQSSYMKSIHTKTLGELTDEQRHDMGKEIAYQELYDYRICEVLVKETYTPAMKRLGNQYSDGWHRYLYLLGKQPHESEFSVCHIVQIHL